MDRCSCRQPGRALPGGLLFCALSSCSLFGPGARVLVQMPEPPPHWGQAFPDLRFVVEYVDAGGCTAEAQVLPGKAEAQVLPGKAAWVECAKEQNAPVLAWPCAEGAGPARGELRPAGGFYPLSLREGDREATLRVTWEDGCAAALVKRLREAGLDMGLFNVARLAAAMRETADPWSWDTAAIAESIAAGSFTSYGLDLIPRRDVQVPATAGTWFIESPFAAPCGVVAGSTAGFAAVPLGAHTLFSADGVRRSLWVEETEIVVGPAR